VSSTPEPIDPAAVAVASVLKSLRTRAGLQVRRLTGTELSLHTLEGLEGVQRLEAQGESPESAIVRAVQHAASIIQPTLSIIADVSLGLRLLEGKVPDPELYGEDLDHRRKALLANWESMHALRSVTPAPPLPTLRTLRFELEAEALGALATILTAPPDDDPSLILDRSARKSEMQADNGSVTTSAVDQAIVPQLPGGHPRTLLQVLNRTSRSLRQRLILDTSGKPAGWPHDLRELSKATALSTAYGVKAMLLLEEDLSPDLISIYPHLAEMSLPGGGYAARTQRARRPEVTATVIDALHHMNGIRNFSGELAQMENDVGDFEKTRPYILSNVLETSVRLQPGSEFAASLIDGLLAIRQRDGQYLVWPEKTEPDLASPQPSTAHTARAVWSLIEAQRAQPTARVQEAVDQAARWLTERADLSNLVEIVERRVDGGIERMYVRHFTAAWVIRALTAAGLPASHPSVSAAVAKVWASYDAHAALWRWRNGELPIWLTYDAVHSLRLAALSTPILPGAPADT
jgi:hypothetical protein